MRRNVSLVRLELYPTSSGVNVWPFRKSICVPIPDGPLVPCPFLPWESPSPSRYTNFIILFNWIRKEKIIILKSIEIGIGRVSAAQWHAGRASVRTGIELCSAEWVPPLLHGLVPVGFATDGRRLRSPADGHWPLLQRRLRRPFHQNQPDCPHLPRRQEIGRTTGTHFTQIAAGHLRRTGRHSSVFQNVRVFLGETKNRVQFG